jgi:toxin-antitoxin system PIN domain toxin
VIAVDTNLLVYAHRADAQFHAKARRLIESLAQGAAPWAIPWPCVHEFFAIVTNARIFKTPTTLKLALEELRGLAALPNVALLAEGEGYLEQLEPLALGAGIQGGAIHDARVAAICLYHGVGELWSADRDFSRYPALKTRNPLTG